MNIWQCVKTLVNIKIAGKWMFIPLKMVLIGIDPYPYLKMKENETSRRIVRQSIGHGVNGCI